MSEASEGTTGNGMGSIVLVATPIGNLGDLSPRAVETLARARVIYCEDTRHSRKLLTHAGITGPTLRSLHEHNEEDRIDQVLREVAAGSTVAVISDAGMPGISDPGSRLVAAAARSGATVSVVPGPSSVVAALVVSGLPTDRFCFEGFLPRSGRDRRRRLEQLAGEERTTVLFEAPGRVAGTLGDLAESCGGNRRVAVARELTKLHEEIWRGSLDEARTWAGAATVRGEVVLVVEGAPPMAPSVVEDAEVLSAIAAQLAAGERTRGAVDAVAAQLGIPRRRVYDLALASTSATTDPDERNAQPGDRVD
ncbi:MAG TPA: 16S rRNA (cytidine(1402)-2'-O)-methyltransferase [Acidimicrobiales bacterium]|nr:16S rRNA (cytidine(1402)-2'-O)-methyltransferase [Acidimicrobiales bacterium]